MVKHGYAPDWGYQETKEKLLGLPFGIVKDFAIMGYCLGGRLNEIRAIRPKDIILRPVSDGSLRIIVTLLTEKNPNMAYGDVPLNPKNEPWYAKHILEWVDNFDDLDEGFPFKSRCERYYQRHLRTLLDIHPHALRHLRVHHVDDNSIPGMKPLTPRQFKDFFRWEKIETSSNYQSRTRSRDLAERM